MTFLYLLVLRQQAAGYHAVEQQEIVKGVKGIDHAQPRPKGVRSRPPRPSRGLSIKGRLSLSQRMSHRLLSLGDPLVDSPRLTRSR